MHKCDAVQIYDISFIHFRTINLLSGLLILVLRPHPGPRTGSERALRLSFEGPVDKEKQCPEDKNAVVLWWVFWGQFVLQYTRTNDVKHEWRQKLFMTFQIQDKNSRTFHNSRSKGLLKMHNILYSNVHYFSTRIHCIHRLEGWLFKKL